MNQLGVKMCLGLVLVVTLAKTAALYGQHPNHPMPMPSPSPVSSPSPNPSMTNMPGMKLPAPSPTPTASPQMQMDMPGMSMPSSSPTPVSTRPGQMSARDMGAMNMNMNTGKLLVMNANEMGVRVGSSQTNIISMSALGSGTSVLPSSSPVYMQHWVKSDWLLMLHYNLVVDLNQQPGPRSATRFESANWFMPMAFHQLGGGTLQLRGMFSAEPFTFPPSGSPLLFQTGETYKGQPLIDRQHPHDLFMELSAQYTLPLGDHGTWFAYFGYPGEPALGPPAFMHRPSASENPSATLAHHLQDSTHISFGVVTTGVTYHWLKIEGSVFNGREPDENRYDFDAHKWNSRSVRLTVSPNKEWAAQFSYGLLQSPEGQEPLADVRRTTASVEYNRPFQRGNWAAAIIWGRNHVSEPGEVRNLNGYTFETTVNFSEKNYLYTRVELVDKDDLLRASDRALLGITQAHPSFRIGAYTFGGARDLWTNDKVAVAVGG